MLNHVAAYGLQKQPDMEPGFGPVLVKWRMELRKNSLPIFVPFGGENGGQLSKCPEYPDNLLQGGGKSNFLVDTLQVMFLHLDKKDDPAKYAAKHEFFVSMLREATLLAPGLQLAVDFFHNQEHIALARKRLEELGAKPPDKAFFLVEGVNPVEDEHARDWWRETRNRLLITSVAKPKTMLCLLSGERVTPAQTHQKISGLKSVGGRGQDIVVGYDKKAFQSYGLEQSENGAMSESMANAYAKGLDDLIRDHSRKLANALVVHWFKDQVPKKDDPIALLEGFEWLDDLEPAEQTEAAAQSRARALLDAIRQGQRSDLGDNRYYAMTLSGASGRVMVRDWMEGNFEELVRNVEAWFADQQIVARDGDGLARDPKFMAVAGALIRELKDLPAPTAATLWKSAVARLPIPRPLMAQALARFRTDLVDKDQPAFNHARMGLIKAYFVRRTQGGDSTVTAYLNPDHPDPAYHCGRLLAVLSNLQHAALGDVGAGVVQRYYAAASQTPGLILGRLAANARNHLGKLDGGLAFWFENLIADVMGHLGDRAPRILDLEGQGLFALGYYQQLAALRADAKERKSTAKIATTGDQQ